MVVNIIEVKLLYNYEIVPSEQMIAMKDSLSLSRYNSNSAFNANFPSIFPSLFILAHE